jgi:hypothetical protein
MLINYSCVDGGIFIISILIQQEANIKNKKTAFSSRFPVTDFNNGDSLT